MGRVFPWLIVMVIAACSSKENAQPIDYTGPLREADEVQMQYSEKDRLKIKMQTKKILEFKNGDQEFPEGIYLEFYDSAGKVTSTLKANHAYYFKETRKWRGRGNVEVKNFEKQQELTTEELFWTPETKKIFTDKFVTIKVESEVIYGVGLDAAQDLAYYSIKDPKGEILVKD